MPLTLNEIYHSTKRQYHLSLLAGESGLYNIMNWVYITEDSSTQDFLKGGELVITTGMHFTNDDILYQFIENLIARNTCGLIINTGKYILADDISYKITQLCEKNHFPLLIMPWEIHIHDITRDYYNRIFLDSQMDTSITNAFISCIRKDYNFEASLDILEDFGYPRTCEYCISILHFPDSDFTDSQKQALLFEIESHLKIQELHLHVTLYKSLFLFVYQSDSAETIRKTMEEISAHLKKYHSQYSSYIGIGSFVHQLTDLETSYKRAIAALSVAYNDGSPIFSFDEMGFFRILYSVNDRELLEKYEAEYLSEIAYYDAVHKTNYLETLRQYLICNGSIQAIAANMYCHRNTVTYRIHVIKENWKINLDDTQSRFHLMAAFYIRDYLSLLA